MAYDANQLQLTHLLQAVASRLGEAKSLQATGGSTTTIIDTSISDDVEDNAYDRQYAFVVRDAAGAGGAPEGEYQRVSAYDASTKTLTTAAFTVAVAVGDDIMLLKNSQFPLRDMVRLINEALRDLGRIKLGDTSLTTATDQREYTLPLAIKGGEILDVSYQGNTGDANDNQWLPVSWRVLPAAPGTQETLVIPQLDSGLTLKVTYTGIHPRLSNYYDPVSEYLPREFIVSRCALRIAEWNRQASKDIMPFLVQAYSNAQAFYQPTGGVRRVGGLPQWTFKAGYLAEED